MTHIVAIVLILGLCLPQALMAGVVLQDSEIDKLKETTDTLSVKKENRSKRIVGKLAGSVLGGVLFGLMGGVAGGAISDCSTEDPYCKLEYGAPGLLLGYFIGVPVGMNTDIKILTKRGEFHRRARRHEPNGCTRSFHIFIGR